MSIETMTAPKLIRLRPAKLAALKVYLVNVVTKYPLTSLLCGLFVVWVLVATGDGYLGARSSKTSVLSAGVERDITPPDISPSIPQPAIITEEFLHALAMVESSGRDNVKPGDGGRALGRFQIHDIYRREANRIAGCHKFTSADRLHPDKAKQMVATVLEYWSQYHARRGTYIGPAELCSLHRHPKSQWSRDLMLTQLEQGRTAKLMQYLGASSVSSVCSL